MAFELFSRVSLAVDVPSHRLRQGDVATIVESHPGPAGGEAGYSLEVFSAVEETLGVVTVRESQIKPLTNNQVLQVRRVD